MVKAQFENIDCVINAHFEYFRIGDGPQQIFNNCA